MMEPLTPSSSTDNIKCMVCYKDYNSQVTSNLDCKTSDRIFSACTQLLKVELILPMQWNFQSEKLPFCDVCISSIKKLSELNDSLQEIRRSIRSTVERVKIDILKSQDVHSKRMMEPLGRRRGTKGSASHLEKVDYFRSVAVKDFDPDVRLSINNAALPGQSVGLPAAKLGTPLKNVSANGTEIRGSVRGEGSHFDDDGFDTNFGETADDPNDPPLSEVFVTEEVRLAIRELPAEMPLLGGRHYEAKYYTKKHGQTYECNLCHRTIVASRLHNLKRHIMSIHEKIQRYQCTICCKKFSLKEECSYHIRKTHFNKSNNQENSEKRQRPFYPRRVSHDFSTCPVPADEIAKRVIVFQNSDTRSALERFKIHYKKVGDKFQCKMCKRKLKTLKDILRHIKLHKGEANFQCVYCSKKFLERYMCFNHIKSYHRDTLEEEYKTLVQGQVRSNSVSRPANISRNAASPSSKSVSPLSRNVAASSYNDVVASTENKPTKINGIWKCGICDFKSKYYANVGRHRRQRHSGRPKLSKARAMKNRNIKIKKKIVSLIKPELLDIPTIPIQTLQNPVQVEGYTEEEGVIYRPPPEHIERLVEAQIVEKRSGGKKRFGCKKCAYTSMGRSNTKRHVREIHLKIMPFECRLCRKLFFSKWSCRSHLLQCSRVGGSLGDIKIKPLIELQESGDSDSMEKASVAEDVKPPQKKGRTTVQNIHIENLCIKMSAPERIDDDTLLKYTSGSGSYFCVVCQKEFKNIKNHIANFHETMRHFKCAICNMEFFYKSKCERHIRETCSKKNCFKINPAGTTRAKSLLAKPKSKQTPVTVPPKPLSNRSDYAGVSTAFGYHASTVTASDASANLPTASSSRTISQRALLQTDVKQIGAGVYQEYYEKRGKGFFCKLCNKRMKQGRFVGNHFTSQHKELKPFPCDFCDEKFYTKPMRTAHVYFKHPNEYRPVGINQPLENPPVTSGDQVYEGGFVRVPSNQEESENVESPVIKSESWLEPIIIHVNDDPFFQSEESDPRAGGVSSQSYECPQSQNIIVPPSVQMDASISSNRETEPVVVNEAESPVIVNDPLEGCIPITPSVVNCDPFIDKNTCKVCKRSFKLRKLVIDHVKNSHLGVRRFQCKYCTKKYYHSSACKQHVQESHIHNNSQEIEEQQENGDPTSIVTSYLDNQPTLFSSDLQISNVRSQAECMDIDTSVESVEIHGDTEITEVIDFPSASLAVEEPMSFVPWKELPSSQEQNIQQPFFQLQSSDDEDDEEDIEPQFVVQEQNGFADSYVVENEVNDSNSTGETSLYALVGEHNIVELVIDPDDYNATEYSDEHGVFTCNLCPRSFGTRTKVVAHINTIHKQLGRFACRLCEKRYYKRYGVAQHFAAAHMNEQLYKCKVCHKIYRHAQGLRKHSMTHVKGKQWCEICKLPFQSPDDLISHMSIVHPTNSSSKIFTSL